VTQPVLVVNGKNDVMVPTLNSYTLFQELPDARLVLYPDSGHARCFSTLTSSQRREIDAERSAADLDRGRRPTACSTFPCLAS
jgi:fermentation-respiration switch protein FrsA (DUF1100 family)